MTCAMPGCERPFSAKGYCKLHYERQRVGTAMAAPIPAVTKETPIGLRLSMQSELVASGCVEWRGTRTGNGYGSVKYEGQSMGAHRAAYLHLVGPIPDGFEIDHLCRNRLCINTDHLEAVPKVENIRRSFSPAGINARKTHCKHGHEFTDENTIRLSGNRRECRACRRGRACLPSHPQRPAHGITRPGGVA